MMSLLHVLLLFHHPMLNICTCPSDHPLAPSTPSLLVCRYISVEREREREKCMIVVTAGFWIRVVPISLNPMFPSECGFNSSRVHTQLASTHWK